MPYNADFSVLGNHDAQVGAKALDQSLDGFDAARSGSNVTLDVVAHSYGTTTTALALSSAGKHVNTFVSLGSAGMPTSVPNAAAIHADHVFAGQARNVLPGLEPGQGDEWAWNGRDFSTSHPGDPMNPSFGATTFGTDGSSGPSPVTDHSTHVKGTDTGYLDPGTESLRNVAYATTGQGSSVTPYHPAPPTPLEQALAGAASSPYGGGAIAW